MLCKINEQERNRDVNNLAKDEQKTVVVVVVFLQKRGSWDEELSHVGRKSSLFNSGTRSPMR